MIYAGSIFQAWLLQLSENLSEFIQVILKTPIGDA